MPDTADPELAARTAKADLAARFWDLGNLIAGFSILQFLAFLAVTYSADANVRLRIFQHPWWLIFMIAGVTIVLFIPSIWLCYLRETALRAEAGHPRLVLATSLTVARGRVIWVLAFSLGTIARVLLHWWKQ